MLSGSPPCSPQTPSLRFGLRAATAFDRELARARRRRRRRSMTNGILREDARSRRTPGGTCRRRRARGPSCICVRSFVPKEKNSATSASSPARTAARGSSIIVPNENGTFGRVAKTSAATLSTMRAHADELLARHRERDHDLRDDARRLRSPTSAGGLEDRAHLHRVDLGVGDREAAAAVTEHRVELVEILDALLEPRRRETPSSVGELLDLLLLVRQELVERRIEQANRDRQAAHLAEDLDEVPLLVGQELRERASRAPRRRRRGSSRAPRGSAPRRRTCARCGRGRCPRRRSSARCARRAACRRSRAPSSCGPRRPSPSARRTRRSAQRSRWAPRRGRRCWRARSRRPGRAVGGRPVSAGVEAGLSVRSRAGRSRRARPGAAVAADAGRRDG